MIKALRAKLHGIRVTGADLNYHGSITLDPLICRRAGMYPLEFVYIWNKNTGTRMSTYIIYGEPGSGVCCLNGAAARLCQKGDELIVGAVEYVLKPADLCGLKPQVLVFDAENRVTEQFTYVVEESGGEFDFAIVGED